MTRVTIYVGDSIYISGELESSVKEVAHTLRQGENLDIQLDSGDWLVLPRDTFLGATFIVRATDGDNDAAV